MSFLVPVKYHQWNVVAVFGHRDISCQIQSPRDDSHLGSCLVGIGPGRPEALPTPAERGKNQGKTMKNDENPSYPSQIPVISQLIQ